MACVEQWISKASTAALLRRHPLGVRAARANVDFYRMTLEYEKLLFFLSHSVLCLRSLFILKRHCSYSSENLSHKMTCPGQPALSLTPSFYMNWSTLLFLPSSQLGHPKVDF